MSDPESGPTPKPIPEPIPAPEPDPPSGPSLTLLYSLIGLALLLAIGFALLIVAPFYHRR